MLLPPGTMFLARVYPHSRVHVDMTALRRTCCASCRADKRVPCSHLTLYPLSLKGSGGNSSDVSSMFVSTQGTWYPLGDYRLVFWANTRQVDGHVCGVFFQAVFFTDRVLVRRDGTKLWHFSAAVFWQKVFGIWSAGSWNFWKVLEGAARNVCTKKERFLFWRFVKEQMRSRLLRPRTIKGRKKRDGRAWATQSNRTNVPNARGTRRFFFWSWSNGSFRHVESLNGIVQMCRDVGTWTNRLCVTLALVCTK